jgi:2-polyprenyl-6-methoxyphenol hydroxylase-like FAD-dependent oxidoreductase
MNQVETLDVVICGAGAAGLTLAIDLARRGVNFRLIEKSPEPFNGSRGKGIQPRTQEVFEDLGILEQVVAAGGLYPPQRKYHRNGTYTEEPLTEGTDPTPAEPHRLALMVPQFATERAMRERLLEFGHRVEFGHELVRFDQDASGVTMRIASASGEEVVQARYLIGTDGGRSFVRRSLDIAFPGKTLGVRGLVADVTLTGLTADAWHRFSDGDMKRQLSLCPLRGTDLFQLQAPIPLEGNVDISADALTQMIQDSSHRTDIKVHSVSWASAFTMSARLADRYRAGRVFIAGDAAHTHPPTGGQGLNTSIQDAYNLGWKLAAVLEGAPTTLLDSYEEERRPIAQDVLGLSVSLLSSMKKGLMARGRNTQQLDLGYHDSSLSIATQTHTHGVRAGSRAPDAPIVQVGGRPIRLFQLFQGPHWTILGCGGAQKLVSSTSTVHVFTMGSDGDLIDAAGHFNDAYALKPDQWVLIRPDGYVSAIFSSGEKATLLDYFKRVGLSEAAAHG